MIWKRLFDWHLNSDETPTRQPKIELMRGRLLGGSSALTRCRMSEERQPTQQMADVSCDGWCDKVTVFKKLGAGKT